MNKPLMRNKIAAVIAVLALSGNAIAQAPVDPRLEAARQLLVVTGAQSALESSFVSLVPMYMENVNTTAVAMINQNPRLGPEDRKAALVRLEALRPQTNASIRKLLTDPGLINMYIDSHASLYAGRMTLDELRQSIAFYKTPAGQKSVSFMPEMGKSMEKLNYSILLPRINALLNATLAEVGGVSAVGAGR